MRTHGLFGCGMVILALVAQLPAVSCSGGGDSHPVDLALSDLGDTADGTGIGDVPDATADAVPIDPHAPVGLKNDVSIKMDDQGVPHLYAKTDEDLFFAQGYFMASERMFSVELFRRRAAGRLSEWYGESSFSSDRTMRVMGFARLGARNLEYMVQEAPRDYRLLRSYVAGFNRRVEEVRSGKVPLPPEYGPDGLDVLPEPMQDVDVLTVGSLLVFGFGAQVEFEILATAVLAMMDDGDLLPAYEPGMPVYIMETGLAAARTTRAASSPATEKLPAAASAGVPNSPLRRHIAWDPEKLDEVNRFLEGVADFRRNTHLADGSNNWVVSAEYSANGRPILSNDPHVGYSAPNDLYLMHLNSADAGGSMDVVGWSFPGVPGIQLGHNKHVAWAATVNFADVADSWMVEIKDGQASLGGKQVAVETIPESILVKQESGELVPTVLEVQRVPGYGVVLPAEVLAVPTFLLGKGSVMVNWVGFDTPDTMTLYNNFNRAQNLDEFSKAAAGQRLGIMNWIGATSEGWRYKAHGFVPDRGPVESRPKAYLVMDGDDASTLWTGKWLSEEQTPHVEDNRPYLSTANNDPWGHCDDGDPGNDEFYYGAYYLPGFRAAGIVRGLDAALAGGKVTPEAMAQLQMDAHSTLADAFLPFLAEAMETLDSDAALLRWSGMSAVREAGQRLLDWDREALRSSSEAALFRIWYAELARLTLGDEMKLAFDGMEGAQAIVLARFVANTLRQQIEGLMDQPRTVLAMQALEQAVTAVAERGGDAYTFGDLSQAWFSASDGGQGVGVSKDGDDSSVNVTQCALWADSTLLGKCYSYVGAIYRAVYSFDDDGVVRMVFNMPEGNASSTTAWVEGQFQPQYFRLEEVSAHVANEWTLEVQ